METLKEKLDRIRERVEGGMSARFLKIIHDAIRELKSSGISERALKTGAAAPRLKLEDQHGKVRSSDEFLALGPLVLVFYRGFW